MWSRSYSKIFKDIKPADIWLLWQDVNNWHKWDTDIEYAKMTDPFTVGSHFVFKPKGAPEVSLELVEVVQLKKYTDSCKFFGARLFGTHAMEETAEGLKLTTTIKVTGPLTYLWVFLVARNIVKELPQQTENLFQLTCLRHA